jgi:uncharacterized protein (TIRG00374 family)
MKLSWKNFFVILFIVIGIIATYFIIDGYGLRDIIKFYKNFDALLLFTYICVILIIYSTLTWRWDTILRSRGHKIPFLKLYIYRIIGASINFFTPGPRVGGEPTQASLLKRHNVEFTEGLSTIMIDKIIDTTTCGLLFIIGAILVGLRYALPHRAGILLTVGAIVFLAIVILFYYQMLNNRHFFLHIFKFFRLNRIQNKTLKKIEQKIEEIELIMIQFYKHDKKTFIKSLGISLLSWAAMFIEYKLATTLLGLNLGMIELFFIITFIGLAVLFPVPMAVGVLEAGQVSAFSMINLAGSAGVALAFLVRMKDFFFGVIGMILLPMYGLDVKHTIERKYAKNKKES